MHVAFDSQRQVATTLPTHAYLPAASPVIRGYIPLSLGDNPLSLSCHGALASGQ